MGRYVKFVVILLVALGFTAMAGLAALFGVAWFNDASPVIVSTTVTPSESAHIGETITGKISVRLPWHRRPVRTPDFFIPDGAQGVGYPRTRLKKIRLGDWLWETSIQVRAADFLDDRTITGRLFFTADRRGESAPLPVTFKLPDIVPRDLAAAAPLVSVPAVPGKERATFRSVAYVLGMIALILVIIAILIAVFRGKGLLPSPPPPPTIWDMAERQLSALERALPMEADAFFLTLTDILRRYIEVRFQCPATERTTPEFLEDTKHADWLTDEQRRRLADVLTSADQAKFARVNATLRDMSQALDAAGHFIAETRPRPEPPAGRGPDTRGAAGDGSAMTTAQREGTA
ncbi:MAG: hypothetical protein RRC34_03715 [Lentisphaeria bacterium]|nr:hypothetical protein [Lentisphaeria bacterium]